MSFTAPPCSSLTTFPNLSALNNLTILVASGNKLSEIPIWLCGLPRIEEADFSHNRTISTIPEEISGLDTLKRLNLDNNNISAIPSSVFIECTALQSIALHNNPITAAQVRATYGYEEFEARRKAKYDKVIGGGVLIGTGGFQTGLDDGKRP